MKKLLLKIVLSVFAAVTMAGCIDMNITADVEEKGDITGSMRLLVHPNVLKMMNMTVDEAMEQLKENYAAEYPDATVDKISEERDGTIFEGVELHNVQNDDFTAETKDGIMTVTIPVRELRDQVAGNRQFLGDDGCRALNAGQKLLRRGGVVDHRFGTQTGKIHAAVEIHLAGIHYYNFLIHLFPSPFYYFCRLPGREDAPV